MIVVVILFFQSICLYLQKIVLNIYDNWLYPQHHRLHVPTARKEQIDQQSSSSSSTSLQYQSNKTNNNNISQYSTYTIYSRDVINSCRFCTNSPIGLCRHHSNPHHPKKGSGKHICRCIKCLQQQQNGKTFLQRLLNWNQTPKITNHKLTIRKSSSSINNNNNNNNINKNNIQEQNNKNSLNNNNNINYSQNDDQYYDENLNNYPTGRINTSLNFNNSNSNSISSGLSKSSGTRAIIYGYDRTDDGVVYMNGEEISRSGKRLRKIRQRI